jgi:hypothetical protein
MYNLTAGTHLYVPVSPEHRLQLRHRAVLVRQFARQVPLVEDHLVRLPLGGGFQL